MADEERTGRRDVLLVGYLTREPHSQALAVDLPRWERGAVRYLLTGDKSRSLGRRVPANKKSPNRQVLEGARRPATTAREVLGGGGAPRSDVRFSPTIVAVRGSARVLSVVHWDAAEDAPARRRKQSVTDPRLPYGGVLYALDVTDVVGVFEHDVWRAAQRRLRPLVAQAVSAIDKGQFSQAGLVVRRCIAALERSFGQVIAPRIQAHDELQRIERALAAEATRRRDDAGAYVLGQSCDRAAIAAGYHYTRANSLAKVLADALGRCAERNYARVVADKATGRTWAASRLVQILEDQISSLPAAGAKRVRDKIARLRAEFGDRLRDVDPPR